MILKNQNLGKIYIIKDVPQKIDCENCKTCMRLRLIEMGLMPGTLIEIVKHQSGLWIVNVLSEFGQVESTIALREEEAERVIVKDEECSLKFESVY